MAQSNSMKERIISHMNKDHGLSLFDYLSVYADIPLDALDPKNRVELIDIDTTKIVLRYTSRAQYKKTVDIPLTPAMTDLGQARERLVEMAHASASKQGFSVQQVTKFVWPNQIMSFSWIFILASVITREYGISKFYGDGWDEYLNPFRWYFLALLLVIHFLETVIIMRNLCIKYRVPYEIRPQWYLSCMLEGFVAWKRFKAFVKK